VRRASKATKSARVAATRVMKKARTTVTRKVAKAKTTAKRAVEQARKATGRKVAKAKSVASKLMKKATRLASAQAAGVAGALGRARSASRKAGARSTPKSAARTTAVVRPAKKPTATPRTAARPSRTAAPTPKPAAAAAAPRRAPGLDRPRRTVADIHDVPSSLDMTRAASAARSGHAEMEQKLHQHTSTSPALSAGDVDADWASAESSGDETPGGDNPTPDQDVVEEIARALGVEYNDDEELQGGDEIAERDRHRWELDPESSDDFDER
ncbi:MAG: DUF6335 family protein, partial [Acidobacteriota bacterium]|nr:DUF6335 family protein [Acidobacteriota bacterium]